VVARWPVDDNEQARLHLLSTARHVPADRVTQARITALSWAGLPAPKIADRAGRHPRTVSSWIHRLKADGLTGLDDRARPGRPRHATQRHIRESRMTLVEPAARYEPTRGLALWGPEEEAAALEVMRSRSPFRYYGPDLLHRADAFEEALAAKLGVPYVVAVSSGTTALACALVGMGMPAGAEVIIPAVTFVGCVSAVVMARGVPVFAEIDDTLTLDPTRIGERVTERTFAIMPVHLCNAAADMDPILAEARRLGVRVLEDAAQAAGVRYRGRPVGSMGDAGAFSFQLDKNITAGEGGAVTTADPTVHERVLRYQDQGGQFTTARGLVRGAVADEPFIGTNLRMTELAASILGVQLGRLDPMLSRMRDVSRQIKRELGDVIGEWRRLPDEEGSGGDLTVLLESRDRAHRFAEALSAAGVSAHHLYSGNAVYSNPGVRDGRTPWGVEWPPPEPCVASERIAGRAVTVDLGAAMTDGDVEWLVETMKTVRATLDTDA
jgi:8-amino-3,8-dideoxy-alpha-D-manno-octulosonate transaminase